MMELKEALAQCQATCESPFLSLQRYKQSGRKAIGIVPMNVPEEIVYALDAVPFGLWGADIPVALSKKYLPTYYCGILHSILELALGRRLALLDGIVLTQLCDSLKVFAQNMREANPQMAFIEIRQPLERSSLEALAFFVVEEAGFAEKISQITGTRLTEEKLARAIQIYNENRSLLREFSHLAATHPSTISPLVRSEVIKAGYFLDRADHNVFLRTINADLKTLPEERAAALRLISTGIIADSPSFLKILGESRLLLVGDDVAHESGQFCLDVQGTDLTALAERYLALSGCSLLKGGLDKRIAHLLDLLKTQQADGLLYLSTKFCDPEEYDFPSIKKAVEQAGYPVLSIEVDKTSQSYEQARTILETFSESFSPKESQP
jgi:benzoyl-CoA reductase/2-hydroxyglutaryl-CoA dehydratase subunit BcrC/BadD/HgdB